MCFFQPSFVRIIQILVLLCVRVWGGATGGVADLLSLCDVVWFWLVRVCSSVWEVVGFCTGCGGSSGCGSGVPKGWSSLPPKPCSVGCQDQDSQL